MSWVRIVAPLAVAGLIAGCTKDAENPHSSATDPSSDLSGGMPPVDTARPPSSVGDGGGDDTDETDVPADTDESDVPVDTDSDVPVDTDTDTDVVR